MGAVVGTRLLLDPTPCFGGSRNLPRLSGPQREALQEPTNEVYVSAATAWELGIKRAKGRLHFAGSVRDILKRRGFVELPVSIAHAERAAALPRLHLDPFDRLLVAQALLEEMVLVTADAAVQAYQVPVIT